MQEQAINTFEEGLVMDLNPLTTPNNVLTNCLNGTMISFNGNEFVLQNDMGNGRVETAYLPAGYVPVGMKEYGGIIYVASYNPIDNKGQIGSFPSPERNISSEELGVANLSLTPTNFGFEYKLKDNNKVLNEEGNPTSIEGTTTAYTKLELLKKESILRPGDKFAIQFNCKQEDLGKLSELLEDYDNMSGTSNKKLIRIRISIADSNGNLVDITEKLKRIREGEILWPRYKDNNEDWLKYKYAGYFMQYTKNNEFTPPTLEDTRRADKFLNVYNNKIAGTLYLTAELATIDSYELEVGGINKGVKGAEIEFTSAYTSEILDTYVDRGANKEDYWYGNKMLLHLKSKATDTIEYSYNVLRKEEGLRDDTKEYTNEPLTINVEGKILNYKGPRTKGEQKIVLNLTGEDVNISTGLLTYSVLPNMKYGKLKTYEKSGFLDINLLGTGTVELNLWQYYTDLKQGKTTIRFGFQAYPREEEPVTAVKFTFYNIKDYKPGEPTKGITKQLLQRVNWHGSFEETFYYGDELEAMTLYIVSIEVYSENGLKSDWSTFRYLYTTELFNEAYSGKTDIDIGEGIITDFDTFNPTPIIKLNSGLNLSKLKSKDSLDITTDESGVISTTPSSVFYNLIEKRTYVYDAELDIKFSNSPKYPFSLQNKFIESTSNSYTDMSNTMLVPGSGVYIGDISSIPTQTFSVDSSIQDNLLTIKVFLPNYLTGIASSSVDFKGKMYQSYFRLDNVNDIFGWQGNTESFCICIAAYGAGRKARQTKGGFKLWLVENGRKGAYIDWIAEGGNGGHFDTWWKDDIDYNGSRDNQVAILPRLSDLKKEYSSYFKPPILLNKSFKFGSSDNDLLYYNNRENSPGLGDPNGPGYWIGGNSKGYENYTMVLWKNMDGEYTLLNMFAPTKDINFNHFQDALDYILTPSLNNYTESLYRANSMSYYDKYEYKWKVDTKVLLNNVDYENVFKLTDKTNFNELTISNWISSIGISEKVSKELKKRPCISFKLIDLIEDSNVTNIENNPKVDSILNKYTKESIDGTILAIAPDKKKVFLGSGNTDDIPLLNNKIYIYLNGHIYDRDSNELESINELDRNKVKISRGFGLFNNNSFMELRVTEKGITLKSDFPQLYDHGENNSSGWWKIVGTSQGYLINLPIPEISNIWKKFK